MKSRLLLVPMLSAVLAAPLASQKAPTKAAPALAPAAPGAAVPIAPVNAAAAAARLRRLYFQRDFEGAFADGPALVARFPAEPALRAWWIMSGSAAGHAAEALAWSDSLSRAFPGTYWSDFTRAYMLSGPGARRDSAYAAAARARTRARGDGDEPWLQAIVRERLGRFAEAVTVADSAIARGQTSAELLVVKGRSLGQLSRGRELNPAQADSAAAALAQALELDSACVSAWQWAGVYGGGSAPEKYARLRRAVQLAPYSLQVHQQYWDGIRAIADRSTEEKTAETVADVEALLRARPDEARVAAAAVRELTKLELKERARALGDQVLARWPESGAADDVLFDRALQRLSSDDSATIVARSLAVRAYLNKPTHPDSGRVRTVLRLFFYDDFSGVPDAELARNAAAIVGSSVLPDAKVQAALALADRGVALDVAERLAREAPDRMRASPPRIVGPDGQPLAPERIQSIVNSQVRRAQDALGWVLFAQGRLGEADSVLRAARDSTFTPLMGYHAGRLAEKRGQLAEALAWYRKGFAQESSGLPAGVRSDAVNEPSLRRVYLALHRSDAGYAALRDSLLALQPRVIIGKASASAFRTAEPVARFDMPRLGGGSVNSESLAGKVTVIDFWGTWCAPCVAEMPAFQRFWERYRADPDVRLITIATHDELPAVRDFMNRRKYDFPVLLDDGYADRIGVQAFPTTWVVDREGRKAFYVLGAEEKELSRLVEELRKAPPRATTKR